MNGMIPLLLTIGAIVAAVNAYTLFPMSHGAVSLVVGLMAGLVIGFVLGRISHPRRS